MHNSIREFSTACWAIIEVSASVRTPRWSPRLGSLGFRVEGTTDGPECPNRSVHVGVGVHLELVHSITAQT